MEPVQDRNKLWSFLSFALIAGLIGLIWGIIGTKSYFEYRMNEAITMQRFVYNKVVYDIMPFDKTGK